MPRLTAKKLRAVAEWEVELEGGDTVLMRRVDVVTAYMTGLLPMPLMVALGKIQASSEELRNNPTPEAMEKLSAEEKAQAIELMRRYACAAIKDPVFVMEDDGHPDHCDIMLLNSDQLLKIWNAVPPGLKPGEGALPNSEVTPAKAVAFRQRKTKARQSPQDGGEIRPASEPVPHAPIAELKFG